MSTVGYGDFVPKTGAGKLVAAGLIMSGICMFAMVTAVIAVKVGHMINYAARCHACNHALSVSFLYCPHCGTTQQQAWPETLEDETVVRLPQRVSVSRITRNIRK